MTRHQILEQAKSLPPQERDELIADLQQLSEPEELSPAQVAELRRRVEAVKRGEMEMIPGEKAMEIVLKRLGR